MRRVFVLILCILAVLVVLVRVIGRTPRPPAQPPTPRTFGAANHPDEIVLHGQVQASSSLVLTSPADGVVGAVAGQEGSVVETGEFIARIVAPELQKQLSEAQAALEAARRPLPDNEPDVQRSEAQVRKALDEALYALEQVQNEFELFKLKNGDAVNALKFLRQERSQAEKAQRAFNEARDAFSRQQANVSSPPTAEEEARLSLLRDIRDTRDEELKIINARREETRRIADQFSDSIRKVRDFEQRLARAEQRVTRARAEKDSLLTAVGEQRLARREAAVQQASARVEKAGAAIEALTISAPRAGRLASLKVRPGQNVTAGQPEEVLQSAGEVALVAQAGNEVADTVRAAKDAVLHTPQGETLVARIAGVQQTENGLTVQFEPHDGETIFPPGTAFAAHIAPGG